MSEDLLPKISLLQGECNTYLIDDGLKVLIDAGFDYEGEVDVVVLTHAHEDHIKYLKVIMERNPKCVVYVNIKELELLMKQGFSIDARFKALYEGKTVIETGMYDLKPIEVSAHTKGSVALWDEEEKVLFSGDTLFKDGVGRTDFPESNPDFIDDAVTLLLGFDAKIILPGHGESFTPEEVDIDKITENK